MSLTKPYFRIVRLTEESISGSAHPYVLNCNYAPDRNSLCRAYKIIQNDLEKVFEYIEPSDTNENTYSHRTFELLLRASTEFETNCKAILRANGYINPAKCEKSWNIKDYYKIDKGTKLSNYKVYLRNWEPSPKVIEPFKYWKSKQTLDWYDAYNAAKHDRNTKFKQADLKNMLEAIAGLFCILYAQFASHIADISLYTDEENEPILSEHWLEGIIFTIEPYTNWSESERYNFDWKTLKQTVNPFEQFDFNKQV